MTLTDAERILLNLPIDHPLAPAIRALVGDRDRWAERAVEAQDQLEAAHRLLMMAGKEKVARMTGGTKET